MCWRVGGSKSSRKAVSGSDVLAEGSEERVGWEELSDFTDVMHT